jgi:hypothetical protein
VLLVLFAGIALTPQGRAVADQILDWIGIGDDPTTTLPTGIDRPDVVIGSGLTPNGVRYEVAASSDKETLGPSPDALTCARVDLLDAPSRIAIECLNKRDAEHLSETPVPAQVFFGPAALGPDRLMIEGFAAPNVDRVELRYADRVGTQRVVEAQVSRIDQSLADQIGAPRTATFVVAFLSEDLVPDAHEAETALRAIHVVALDPSGAEVSDLPLSETASALALYSK